MKKDIDYLKSLVAEFEHLEQSTQPYAYDAALNTLDSIECQASILRNLYLSRHKKS